MGEEMLSISPETFEPLLYLGGAAVGAGLLLALLSRRPTLGRGFVYLAPPAGRPRGRGGAGGGAGRLLALLSRRPGLGWGFVYRALPALALLALSWVDVA